MAVVEDGRLARTHFSLVSYYDGYSLVKARLETGRTHQIRVHFASIGHPIAGDRTYGTGRGPAGLKRQFVHSHSLRLRSPHDGQERTFVAELPPDLLASVEALRRRGHRLV